MLLSLLYTVLLGVVVLSLAVLAAVAGLMLAQRWIPLELRKSHNLTIGIIYAALYVTFGVIIGFSAYIALNKYTLAQQTVVNEAGAVRSIYHLAGEFPEPQRDQIQQLASSYARAVVDEEWPLMQKGQTSSHATSLTEQLRQSVDSVEPSTSAEQARYTQALERTNELLLYRDARLLDVREGLPPILWVVLVVLAVTIILFTYFLGMESARLHMVAVAALTAGIAFTIFAIVTLDSPFGGELRVNSAAFELVLQEIEGASE